MQVHVPLRPPWCVVLRIWRVTEQEERSSQVRVNVSRCCLAGYSEVLTESEQLKAV